MRVVQSNSVFESKSTLGLPSAVASPSLSSEGAYGTAGVRIRCLDLSKKCSARALGDAGMGKREPALVLASASLQYKEGGEDVQAKGRYYAEQMVVE